MALSPEHFVPTLSPPDVCIFRGGLMEAIQADDFTGKCTLWSCQF